jgi:hypothetical protein
VVLAGCVAAWGVAGYFSNPERTRERLRSEIAAGRSVTLLRDTGPPVYYRWCEGAAGAKASAGPERPFFISTHDTALLELSQASPAAFRFQADVRHDQNAGDGQVGIYFARRRPDPAPPWKEFKGIVPDLQPRALMAPGPRAKRIHAPTHIHPKQMS